MYKTKTQKKNALKAIEKKAAKLAFSTGNPISIAEYSRIAAIAKKGLKKL